MDLRTATSRLDTLGQTIRTSRICPELRDQPAQLVLGTGNPLADIMFIGEAPGKQEDIQGRPFVGAAGKYLNTLLEDAGLQRDDVYITNIVKYRPPNNRDPKPEEKAAFLPFLLEELSIVKPKIIATLGRHSMEYFLPGRTISEVHGQPYSVSIGGTQYTLIPLFHPSYAQYNGSYRPILHDDFMKLPGYLQNVV